LNVVLILSIAPHFTDCRFDAQKKEISLTQ
jgi:hypothetical protein